MASQEREPHTSIKDRLFEEFYSFSFFKAVHLIESLLPERKALGQTLAPSEEAVRFCVKTGSVFPPSDISDLRQEDEKDPVTIEIPFMGLIGPSGVLPYWINELAAERLREKDSSLTAFFDIFHHRLISLFYLAWKKHRFPENYLPGAKDRLSRCLLGLMGLGTRGLAPRLGLPLESLIYYSGLLSRPVPSAAAIEAAVEYFSGATVRLDQFIDRVIPVSPEDRTKLGAANSSLGVDAVCGSQAWESQTKFRVNLGPMGYEAFVRLMPSGDMLDPIFSLVRYIVGIEYEFEIGVILLREEVPPCVLGAATPTSPRLGWSTWVKTPGVFHQDHPNVIFQEPGSHSSV
ncbi:MAG: type VI secretion system baseplate subunit TssG [Syntrophobacteraceae bacterium]